MAILHSEALPSEPTKTEDLPEEGQCGGPGVAEETGPRVTGKAFCSRG